MRETFETKSTELAVQIQQTMTEMFAAMARRMRDERGQTATEYVGIILVVVAIIGAIVASGIGSQITGKITQAINSIKSG